MEITRLVQQPSKALSERTKIKQNPMALKHYATEKSSSEIGDLMNERSFSSQEEINAFVNAVTFVNSVDRKDIQETYDKAERQKMMDVINKAFPNLAHSLSESKNNLPPERKAKSIMYDAWDAEGEDRIKLAKEALAIDNNCVDAYVLLAQINASTVEEAKDLFAKGSEIGQKLLDEDILDNDNLWAYLEARPYMRARAGLAECLWSLGQRKEAIKIHYDLLRLNRGDNQGIRYKLINQLLSEKLYNEADELLEKYASDCSAVWHFSQALYFYLRTGKNAKSDTWLRVAIKANEHVASFLLEQKTLPEIMPAYVGHGNEDEAAEYAIMSKEIWQANPESLSWLAEVIDAVKQREKSHAHKVWQDYMTIAQKEYETGKYNKAKGLLLFALKQAEKFGEDEYMSQTLTRIAYVCLANDAQNNDESIFKRSVAVTENIYGSRHQHLPVELYHLACFYLQLNRLDEGETVFQRAIALIQEQKPRQLDLLEHIYTSLASLYSKQGKDTLAQQTKKEAQKLAKELDEHEYNHDHDCSKHDFLQNILLTSTSRYTAS